MSWRKVVSAVGFAVAVTTLGVVAPRSPAAVFLLPAFVARPAFGLLTEGPRESWVALWLTVYAQLFVWTLIWELLRSVFSGLRGFSAKRAVRV